LTQDFQGLAAFHQSLRDLLDRQMEIVFEDGATIAEPPSTKKDVMDALKSPEIMPARMKDRLDHVPSSKSTLSQADQALSEDDFEAMLQNASLAGTAKSTEIRSGMKEKALDLSNDDSLPEVSRRVASQDLDVDEFETFLKDVGVSPKEVLSARSTLDMEDHQDELTESDEVAKEESHTSQSVKGDAFEMFLRDMAISKTDRTEDQSGASEEEGMAPLEENSLAEDSTDEMSEFLEDGAFDELLKDMTSQEPLAVNGQPVLGEEDDLETQAGNSHSSEESAREMAESLDDDALEALLREVMPADDEDETSANPVEDPVQGRRSEFLLPDRPATQSVSEDVFAQLLKDGGFSDSVSTKPSNLEMTEEEFESLVKVANSDEETK
jgi:hypothetical protein